MKKQEYETISSFNKRFVSVYYNMPKEIQPSVGASKLHNHDAFESDFALLLRKRKLVSLPFIFKNSLEVEANMMESGKIK